MLNLKIPNTLNRVEWTRINGRIVRRTRINYPTKETVEQKLINYLSGGQRYNPLIDPNALEYRRFNDFLERRIDWSVLSDQEKRDFLFEMKKTMTPREIASSIDELKPVIEEFIKMLNIAKKPESIATAPEQILMYQSFHEALHDQLPGFENLFLENMDQLKVVNTILNSELSDDEKIKALNEFSFIKTPDYKPYEPPEFDFSPIKPPDFEYVPIPPNFEDVPVATIEISTPSKIEKYTVEKRNEIITEIFQDKTKSDFFINELNDLPVIESNAIVATLQETPGSKDLVNEAFIQQNFKKRWNDFSAEIRRHRIPYKYEELYNTSEDPEFKKELLKFFELYIKKCFNDRLVYFIYSDYNKDKQITGLTAQRFCLFELVENGIKASWIEAGKKPVKRTRQFSYSELITRSTHLVFLEAEIDEETQEEYNLLKSYPSRDLQILINKECGARAALEIDIQILKSIINKKITAPAA
jgi:hypothetical protein